MQALAKAVDLIQSKKENAIALLKMQSRDVTENGINALELIESPPVSSETFLQVRAMLEANFGKDYSNEKMALLFDMIRDDAWTEERFSRTLKWFLKTKHFRDWTVADWFSYAIKVYPYSWYLEQVKKCGQAVNMQIQNLRLSDDTVVFRYRDHEILPFEEV